MGLSLLERGFFTASQSEKLMEKGSWKGQELVLEGVKRHKGETCFR
jgi:hypothetical protein